MRINLGCGDQYAHGWINVDHGSPHQKDLDVDLTGELPWPPNSVERVYAGHVLEHLTLSQCTGLLERLLSRMVPGGQLLVVGPDVERAQAMADAGTLLDITMDELRHGAGRWSGDVHHWECTPQAIISMLRATGWKEVSEVYMETVPADWPVAFRGPRWQCVVSAVRWG